jgi:hypothetical protein
MLSENALVQANLGTHTKKKKKSHQLENDRVYQVPSNTTHQWTGVLQSYLFSSR